MAAAATIGYAVFDPEQGRRLVEDIKLRIPSAKSLENVGLTADDVRNWLLSAMEPEASIELAEWADDYWAARCPDDGEELGTLPRGSQNRLVLKHQNLVRAILRKHNVRSNPDLAQEGLIALIAATRHYDPTKGAAFSSYAWVAINNHINYVLSRQSRLKVLRNTSGRTQEWDEQTDAQTLAFNGGFTARPRRLASAPGAGAHVHHSYKNTLPVELDDVSYEDDTKLKSPDEEEQQLLRWLRPYMPKLTAEERWIVRKYVRHELVHGADKSGLNKGSTTSIARELGIHRGTMSARRDAIRAKLADLKDALHRAIDNKPRALRWTDGTPMPVDTI